MNSEQERLLKHGTAFDLIDYMAQHRSMTDNERAAFYEHIKDQKDIDGLLCWAAYTNQNIEKIIEDIKEIGADPSLNAASYRLSGELCPDERLFVFCCEQLDTLEDKRWAEDLKKTRTAIHKFDEKFTGKKLKNEKIASNLDVIMHRSDLSWRLKKGGEPTVLLQDGGKYTGQIINTAFDPEQKELVITYDDGMRFEFNLKDYDLQLQFLGVFG